MKTTVIKISAYIICLTFILLLSPQCKKDKNELIPYVYVNFSLNPSSTQYNNLNNIGGWVYVTGGVRGIILYHASVDQFMAYERDCPYEPLNTCALVQVEKNGVVAIDSCCGSQFVLTDGSPIKGPAATSLKQYTTTYDGTTLTVTN
jgi:nitrite reductase/ring-hydroxylating ferredoxin subunit